MYIYKLLFTNVNISINYFHMIRQHAASSRNITFNLFLACIRVGFGNFVQENG
jgi:hypothetical protein